MKKVGSAIKRNWKKVSLVGLLGAAAFFTFGAALGVTGGWAAKVGAFASKLGVGGKMANVISGAITHAGTGAWLGGVTGLATGQGFMKGAGVGALSGAAAGGALGAFRPVSDAVSGGLAEAGGPAPSGAGVAPMAETASTAVPGAETPPSVVSAAATTTPSVFQRVYDGVVGSGGLGPIVMGIGQGLAAGGGRNGDTAEETERRERSYDIDYRPLRSMFERAGSRVLAKRTLQDY